MPATSAVKLSGALDFMQGLQFINFHFMKNKNI